MLHFIAPQTKDLKVTQQANSFFSELSTIAAITGIVKNVTIPILHEESFEIVKILQEATFTFQNCMQEPKYRVCKHCKKRV